MALAKRLGRGAGHGRDRGRQRSDRRTCPILAVELKPLRVNGVAPGVIDTPWWDAMPEDQKQAMFKDFIAKTPVGRVGRPEDVAQAIAFLIADDFITGQMLICDGGLRLTA